jgi:hypothetical protein
VNSLHQACLARLQGVLGLAMSCGNVRADSTREWMRVSHSSQESLVVPLVWLLHALYLVTAELVPPFTSLFLEVFSVSSMTYSVEHCI